MREQHFSIQMSVLNCGEWTLVSWGDQHILLDDTRRDSRHIRQHLRLGSPVLYYSSWIESTLLESTSMSHSVCKLDLLSLCIRLLTLVLILDINFLVSHGMGHILSSEF